MRQPQGVKLPKRINIGKLKSRIVSESLTESLKESLESTPMTNLDVEAEWAAIRSAVYKTATELLGSLSRRHKDSFDENNMEIQHLLVEKHKALKALHEDPMSVSKKDTLNNIKNTITSSPTKSMPDARLVVEE